MPCQQVHEGHAGLAVRPRHSRANMLGHARINIQTYTSLKKQDSAPVWHAGPEGRTFSKTASRSQSSRTSTTSIALPDVAPAVAEYLPAPSPIALPRVDRQHHALGAEHVRAARDQRRIGEGRAVDRHLVSAVGQQL